MAEPLSEPLDFARQDLHRAVTVALSRDGHLLTAGEHRIARRFLALPEEAASLYARLHARRPLAFRIDQLDYAEITDLKQAVQVLLDAGLIFDDRLLPRRIFLELRTVAELKALCRANRLKVSGRREAVLERLMDADLDRAGLRLPTLMLRHQALFRRLCRLFLYDHSGDLSRLVIARLGHLQFPPYTPTGGIGLFPRRRELLGYERALHRRWTASAEEAVLDLPGLVAEVEFWPMPADHRYRFSARRFAVELALTAARELERAKQQDVAAVVYRRLLDAGLREPGPASRRLALCLEGLKRPGEAAAVCATAMEKAQPAEALALERTGRRLARKARIGWRPRPPLKKPPTRQFTLPAAKMGGNRLGYRTPNGAAAVEAALCRALRLAGRTAFFGEAAPWSTLFGLLCYDALFAPVPGMLPTKMMHRPLDLGAPGFRQRRGRWLTPILAQIAAGDAQKMLIARLPELEGMVIAGVRWDRFTPAQLVTLAGAIDGASLAGVLRSFAEDWRGANRGLPDLCVLPGPAVRLDNAAPATIPEGLILAEVKGPTDALRDPQRVWLDRLLRFGVRAELWKVKREVPPSGT
ncbi:MAG: VRR-NUC domain-containing protein [Myxococcota bacterium]